MVTQNNCYNSMFAFPLALPLSQVTYKLEYIANASSGDVDVYTCPSGKRAWIQGSFIKNTNSTTTTFFSEIKSGGTYYQVSPALSKAQGAVDSARVSMVLDAGETISFNSTQTGMNVYYSIAEFPDTYAFHTAKVYGLSTGDNTIYTCPGGKTAYVIDGSFNLSQPGGLINYFNASGTTKTILAYTVPNGGSVGSTNQCIHASVTNNSNLSSASPGSGSLNAGDFVVINTSAGSSTQTAWVTVLEI